MTIEVRWLKLSPSGPHESLLENQGTVAVLSVFVYAANNVVEDLNGADLEDGLPTTR